MFGDRRAGAGLGAQPGDEENRADASGSFANNATTHDGPSPPMTPIRNRLNSSPASAKVSRAALYMQQAVHSHGHA